MEVMKFLFRCTLVLKLSPTTGASCTVALAGHSARKWKKSLLSRI